MRDGRIPLAAVGLAVADAVEPMAGPVFGELRRGEQPLDELLPSVWCDVAAECRPFLGRGGQAGEGEGHAAQKRVGVGLAGGLDAGSGQLFGEKSVDRVIAVAEPAGRSGGSRRYRRPPDRLQAPPLFAAREDRCPGGLLGEFLDRGRHRPRVGSTQCDPPLEGKHDLGRRLRASLRHEQVILMPQADHDTALLRLARHDGRPGEAAFAHAVGPVEGEVVLSGAVCAVALVAAFNEIGADDSFEEVVGFAGQSPGRPAAQERHSRRRQQQQQEAEAHDPSGGTCHTAYKNVVFYTSQVFSSIPCASLASGRCRKRHRWICLNCPGKVIRR